jgi:hypothetical protein
MSYKILVTGTKSAESEWFINLYPETVSNLRIWEYAQPGFIDLGILSCTDTTIEILMEFDTEESYNLFTVNRQSNLDWQFRNEYYNNIGLVIEVEILSV